MSKTTIPRGGITADAIDATLIADDAISEEHIDATVITASTALAAEPADTDEFLISDAGTIKRIDYSYIKGGGRSTLLNTTTLSSSASQFDITDVMSDTYSNYLLVWYNGTVSQDGADLRITFFAGSGTGSHIAGGDEYRYVNHQLITEGTDNSDTNTTNPFYRPNKSGIGNAADESFNGTMMIWNARSTSKSTLLHSELSYTSSAGHAIGTRSHGIIKPTNALTGLRFEVASGSMNSGTWKFYGLE